VDGIAGDNRWKSYLSNREFTNGNIDINNLPMNKEIPKENPLTDTGNNSLL